MRIAITIAIVALLAGTSCARKWKYEREPSDYLRTDSAMIKHDSPNDKSSTGVGIPGY